MNGPGEHIARTILASFDEYCTRFSELTAAATSRFAARDWLGLQEDAAQRLSLYDTQVDRLVEDLTAAQGPSLADRRNWESARKLYQTEVVKHPGGEVGKTYFSSTTRRILKTEGTDPGVEFTDDASPAPAPEPQLLEFQSTGLEETLLEVLASYDFGAAWQNVERDVRLAALEIDRRFALHGEQGPVRTIATYPAPFFRGRAAYLVGVISAARVSLPLAIAIHHTSRGLIVGSVLLEPDDISVLFSYTRSSFMVETEHPAELVGYLGRLMPHRKPAELYAAIGHNKHGKTERYRDLRQFISDSGERFEYARGIRGMVMIVFTLPGYDAVFKVIRDRFPYPKQTTRRQVMAKYRLVFGHDRAGRLIDAHEFEHLRFGRDRFDATLLEELQNDAARSVSVNGDTVTLHHVYVERKVVPLDIYLRESNPVKAKAAMIDYGRAIKNLALSDIFPGDMLLKNFGVTRSGRVVFYDYDELARVTDCKFRELPQTSDPDDEMAADPWFGVGETDIFPEEFRNFLGVRGELRDVMEQHHGDLFGVRFWQRVQDRIRSGEVVEIFPYKRSRRLGAGVRRRARTV